MPDAYRSPADRAHAGEAARVRVPLGVHAELRTADRLSPVRVLADQGATRVPELLPVRHTRMSSSPFAF